MCLEKLNQAWKVWGYGASSISGHVELCGGQMVDKKLKLEGADSLL